MQFHLLQFLRHLLDQLKYLAFRFFLYSGYYAFDFYCSLYKFTHFDKS